MCMVLDTWLLVPLRSSGRRWRRRSWRRRPARRPLRRSVGHCHPTHAPQDPRAAVSPRAHAVVARFGSRRRVSIKRAHEGKAYTPHVQLWSEHCRQHLFQLRGAGRCQWLALTASAVSKATAGRAACCRLQMLLPESHRPPSHKRREREREGEREEREREREKREERREKSGREGER